MSFEILEILVAVVLFLGMVIASEFGRRSGVNRLKRHPEGLPKGVSAAEGAVFALLGLLIAFSFSGAATRFQGRRHLITEEANAIGTAYLRIEMLPDDLQANMREQFRKYLDLRLETYRLAGNLPAAMAKYAESTELQETIWSEAVAACKRDDAHKGLPQVILSSLNTMFDITTTRLAATRDHPPMAIYFVLFLFGLVGAFIIGFNMSIDSTGSRFHSFVFAAIMSLMILVIVDLEYPRVGFIRVDGADRLLIELRESMN